MAFNPANYHYLGGKTRNYVDKATGEVLSRRQYDKLKQKAGIDIKSGLSKKVVDLASSYKSFNFDRRTIAQIANSPDFWQLMQDLRSKDISVLGVKDMALRRLGRRNSSHDSYLVGETPKL